MLVTWLVGALAMGDTLLEELRAGVQDRVKAKEGEWDEDDWTPFVKEKPAMNYLILYQ